MGRDVTLFPSKASRLELRKYLEDLGFQRCSHLWDWPRGTLNYHWFDHHDYRSIDGVSADIYPVSDEDLAIHGSRWALHVRNLYSASWHDVSMLNSVLRGARRRFGGTLQGDFGTNRYAPLWKDKSTPISRGVASIFHDAVMALRDVRFALPDPSVRFPVAAGTGAPAARYMALAQSQDPSRVIYNGLVPFALSAFEYFFSNVFMVLVAYDGHAIAKRSTHKLKLDLSTLLEVDRRERTVESVIAESYSFQNLDQLNKAYIEWLQIDVKKVLYRKKRIGRKVQVLMHMMDKIIKHRHGVVHRFEIDRGLDRPGCIAIFDAVEVSISEFVRFLEQRLNVTIDRQ